MPLTTSCPRCGTTFKVVLDHLRVRNGLVRCGVCATVFNGQARLQQLEDETPTHHAPEREVLAPLGAAVQGSVAAPFVFRNRPRAPVQEETSSPAEGDNETAFPTQEVEDWINDPPWVRITASRAEPRLVSNAMASNASESIGGHERSLHRDKGITTEVENDTRRMPLPEFLDLHKQRRHRRWRWVWGIACLLGCVVGALQLVYVYRVNIVTAVPPLRPVIEKLCRPLGCTIGYTRQLALIDITSSSLAPRTDTEMGESDQRRFWLQLVLRNRYDKPQYWPTLVLGLTDTSDTVVVRKFLRPEDYLTPEQLRSPFGPNKEQKISVAIDVRSEQINGYKLDKFFP